PRRHASADAAHLRAEGAPEPEAHRREHAALLGRRCRTAAADPAADERGRPEPRGRRARAAARGRAAADAYPHRAHGARDARSTRRGAPELPARPRPLPTRTTTRTAEEEVRWISTS